MKCLNFVRWLLRDESMKGFQFVCSQARGAVMLAGVV
jgi:hypothetical protein